MGNRSFPRGPAEFDPHGAVAKTGETTILGSCGIRLHPMSCADLHYIEYDPGRCRFTAQPKIARNAGTPGAACPKRVDAPSAGLITSGTPLYGFRRAGGQWGVWRCGRLL